MCRDLRVIDAHVVIVIVNVVVVVVVVVVTHLTNHLNRRAVHVA